MDIKKYKIGESVSFDWGDETISGVIESLPKAKGRKDAVVVRDAETKILFRLTDTKVNASTA